MFGSAEVSRLQHSPKSSHWQEGNPFAWSAPRISTICRPPWAPGRSFSWDKFRCFPSPLVLILRVFDFDRRMSRTHRGGNVMKPLVAAKLILLIASLAAWSIPSPATAQSIVGARVPTGNGTRPQSPPSGKPGRSSPRSPGQFHTVCITQRGPTCDVTSSIPILPDNICHCGPNIGATFGPSQ